MAILQSTDELETYIGNKYSLVIVAAKRARQLKEGHQPLARETSPNPLSVALTEVRDHRLQAIAPPIEDLAPAPRDVITSLVSGAGFDLDEDLLEEDSDAVDDLAALLVGADEDDDAEPEEEDDLLTPARAADDGDADVDLEESDDEDDADDEDDDTGDADDADEVDDDV